MTALTSVQNIITGNAGHEVLNGTGSDGATYATRFSTIVKVSVNNRTRTGAWASVSGGTVTVHCTSASSEVFDLDIWGC